jgi:hypothetical protein
MEKEELSGLPSSLLEVEAAHEKKTIPAEEAALSIRPRRSANRTSSTTTTTTEEPSSAKPPSSGPLASAAGRRRTFKSALRRRRPTAAPIPEGVLHQHPPPRSERRVRGLWTNESPSNAPAASANLFSRLHGDTMVHIFSHLNVLEAHQSATACQRWRHVLASAEHKTSIRHVDATEFLHHVHDACGSPCNSAASTAATTTTSQVLERLISQYRPDRLTIRDIGHRLSSEFCIIPNVHRLVELTLTHYDALTDLTLHAMLLLTSATPPSSTDPDLWMHVHGRVQRTSGTSLQTLRLESCPLLTDAAVRSIALTCPNLHVLSLRGCRSIGSVVPLRALWKVTTRTSPVPTSGTSPMGPSVPPSLSSGKQLGSAPPLSLASLFVATSATTAAQPARTTAQRMGRSRRPHLESMFAVPPPPSPTSVATMVHGAEEEEATSEGGPDLAWDANANRTSPLCLADLFAAPSRSTQSVPAPSPAFRSVVGSSAALQGPRCGGALIDVDVSDTSVAPAAVLDALRSTPGPTSVVLFPTKVHLERLMASNSTTISGDCQLWMPRQLEDLANLIHVSAVKETDVGIFETTTSSFEPQPLHVAHAGIRSH